MPDPNLVPKPNDETPVVYSPPAPEALDVFARRVCRALGAAFDTPDVVRGFSAFVQLAAEIQAKHLTRKSEAKVDNEG